MLEKQLERLNTNIERLIAVFGTGAPLADQPQATDRPKPVTTDIRAEDVKDALVHLARKTGRGPAAEILSAFGVARVAELKPSDYAAVIEKVQEAWKALPAEVSGE